MLEDYLVTVLRLEQAYGYARTGMVASELGVKPGTASKVLRRLEGKGLVVRHRYRGVRLTEEGRRLALEVLRRHRAAERLLLDVLGLDALQAHELAHILEHAPGHLAARIEGLVEDAEEEPRGVRLTEASPGSSYVVTGMLGELREAMRFFADTGIRAGCRLRVVHVASSAVEVELERSRRLVIPWCYAHLLLVEPSPQT